MHAITQIHYQGGHVACVLLHDVREAEGGFALGEGRDTPAAVVATLLNSGAYIRVAVATAAGGFAARGFVTRSWLGELIALPLVACEHTRLDALPTY